MIEVRNLKRRFGDFEAVRDVSFEVAEGEIFGFIGPNGAGKTTTIRILATLDLPTSGSVKIMGHDVTQYPEKVRDLMGFMPDVWGVYPDVRVSEYLEFFAAAYGIPRRERARTVGDVMELTDLATLRGKLVETLSKGMKQRLCLAKTLIHDPSLLILDEPANGLDPRARIELRELLRELAAMGKTILISSHILTELSDLVTSVGIVERGQTVLSGPLESIVASLSGASESTADLDVPMRRFELRTTQAHLARALQALYDLETLLDVATAGEQSIGFAFRGPEQAVAEVVRALTRAQVDILGLREDRADLESVFMALTHGAVQ